MPHFYGVLQPQRWLLYTQICSRIMVKLSCCPFTEDLSKSVYNTGMCKTQGHTDLEIALHTQCVCVMHEVVQT